MPAVPTPDRATQCRRAYLVQGQAQDSSLPFKVSTGASQRPTAPFLDLGAGLNRTISRPGDEVNSRPRASRNNVPENLNPKRVEGASFQRGPKE